MLRKKLSFKARAALAFLSGLLAWPALILDARIAPMPLRVHPAWILLYATAMVLAVLSPFLGRHKESPLRLAVLVAGATLACHVAFRLPLTLDIELFGPASPYLVAGASAAVLLALLTWLIAPLGAGPRLWSLLIVAGGLGGLLVYQLISLCELGENYCPARHLPVALGWAGWQLLFFLAMYFGGRNRAGTA